eukprot:gene5856-biopygen4856
MDYEQLCSLDVLGLKDSPIGDQQPVYEEFKEQLIRNPAGWYETGLLWKSNHDALHNNKGGSLGRLSNLVRRLQREPALLERYDEIIQDQLQQGIVERVTEESAGKEFYIPHKPVVRENAESTKVRIVFDASAKGTEKSPSLNDCLEPGQPLQNLLWSMLVRNRLKPVALCGDLKQAFLQVRIKEEDRDALRFHWIKNKDPAQVEVLRFTRALFGLVQSPFLLGATIEEHLSSCESNHSTEIEEIRRSLYVDDVISGACTVEEAQHLKKTAISVFGEAAFQLHKWHSNMEVLESEGVEKDGDQSYAKKQLGVRANETKMLGLTWNKAEDSLGIAFPEKQAELTKRGVLRNLASIYDPLGIASPVTLLGKFVYRECCDQRLPWDKQLPEHISQMWKHFEKNLPKMLEVPRSLCASQEQIIAVDLHVFGDSSGRGTSSVVYTVVHQDSAISQGLIAAKARLAKKDMSIPRLELISAHMAANLVANVKEALQGFPIRDVYGWLDSTVALHWIKGNGNYKQFVSNRIKLIREKHYINWRHVRTGENPADIGSRGEKASKLSETWLSGPKWLSERSCWPEEVQIVPSSESEAEAKLVKEVLAVSVESTDQVDNLISKFNFWKTIRITAFCQRFAKNCRAKKAERLKGLLTTEETQKAIQHWVIKTQEGYENTEKFNEDKERLNLQKNGEGVYECRGRIQGDHPIYLPPQASFTAKMVEDAHIETLHGGVGLTMAWIRRNCWIPRLRQLTKKIIKGCYGCKRFHTTAYATPPRETCPKIAQKEVDPFK